MTLENLIETTIYCLLRLRLLLILELWTTVFFPYLYKTKNNYNVELSNSLM